MFDASSGRVLLGPAALRGLLSTPVHVVTAAVQATTVAAQQLASLAGEVRAGQAGVQSALLLVHPIMLRERMNRVQLVGHKPGSRNHCSTPYSASRSRPACDWCPS